MKKTPTVFRRNPEDMKHVTDEVNPECQWVLDGEGVPTRKYDGTCVMCDEDGNWWARREVKPGKTLPPNFRAEETDPNTGKTVGWEPSGQSPFAKFIGEALAGETGHPAGTYELCGPKINGNPEGYETHVLIRHAAAKRFSPMSPDALIDHCREMGYEGIVWHHPDGRMAKLKVRDYPILAATDDEASGEGRL